MLRDSEFVAVPFMEIVPESGLRSKAMDLASVDLPQPDSPTTDTISPRRICNETPLRASMTQLLRPIVPGFRL